ncbi:MAG: CRISPR-associated endonuclease Cas1 [Anaerolineales bacterium]|nr:CRISPR-associated endonuclease Cas1 [Anaerolineales bacterium]MDW8447853.1 CRISPR-associated endonuclease Cas1 [Anaerolineales bacterium]
MTIIQHLIVDQYGAFIGKHSERLIVTKGEEKIAAAPLIHLESVVIANRGVSISAEAVRECTERGIPIYFISATGTPYASLYSAGLIGTVATRRAQLEAYHQRRALELVLAFGIGKLKNQSNLLKYIAKYRKENDPELYQELRLSATEIVDQIIELERLRTYPGYRDGTVTVNDLRAELMGIEGQAAQIYWRAVGCLLPQALQFPGRIGRGAKDPVNACLNYAYGILYAQIERCLVLAGLDPYAGFLHVDRPGKPSLTLDFIEEFRPVVVDRTILGMFNKGWMAEFDEHYLLTKETRRTIVEKINERLDTPVPYEGKRHPLRAVLQMQARHIATFLRGERLEYTPFEMAW